MSNSLSVGKKKKKEKAGKGSLQLQLHARDINQNALLINTNAPTRQSESISCVKKVRIVKGELFKDGLVKNKQDAKNPNTNTVNIREGCCYSPVNNSSARCVYEQTALLKHSDEHQ